jgi:hypothetical protein
MCAETCLWSPPEPVPTCTMLAAAAATDCQTRGVMRCQNACCCPDLMHPFSRPWGVTTSACPLMLGRHGTTSTMRAPIAAASGRAAGHTPEGAAPPARPPAQLVCSATGAASAGRMAQLSSLQGRLLLSLQAQLSAMLPRCSDSLSMLGCQSGKEGLHFVSSSRSCMPCRCSKFTPQAQLSTM